MLFYNNTFSIFNMTNISKVNQCFYTGSNHILTDKRKVTQCITYLETLQNALLPSNLSY